MRRPIVIALLFLLAGIIAGQYDWGIVLFCGCMLAIICLCLYARTRYIPVFLFLLFAAAGLIRVKDSLRTNITQASDTVQVLGFVRDTGTTGSGVKLIIDATWDTEKDGVKTARIVVYTRYEADAVVPGDVIRLTGRVLPLEKPRNPGDYNEWLSQRTRKIDAKMYTYTVDIVEHHLPITAPLSQLKQKLASVYRYTLPEREAAIIQSIILGDKAGLPEDTRELFKQAGIFHLLCISGLHIAIIMMGLYKLLQHRLLGCLLNPRSAGIVALVFMILYCLLTGSAVSTVRAVTMCGVAVFARVLFRQYDLITSTTFACVVLLLYEPLYLYDVGFQLSFGAVFGIAVLTKPIEHGLLLLRIPHKSRIKNALAANMAATAATLPILCYHFYYVPTYALLVNLIILPTAAALVTLGLFIGLTGMIWLPAAAFLSGAVYYLLLFYDFVCRFFVSLPFSIFHTGYLGLWTVLAAIGFMLAFAYMLNGFGTLLRRRVVWPTVAWVVLVCCLLAHAYPSGLTLMMLDAEQGYFAVITHRGRTFVTGSGFNETDTLQNYYNRLNIRQGDGHFFHETHNLFAFERAGPDLSGTSLVDGSLRLFDGDEGLMVAYGEAVLFLPRNARGEVIIITSEAASANHTALLPNNENNQVYRIADNGAFSLKTDGKRLQVFFVNDRE